MKYKKLLLILLSTTILTHFAFSQNQTTNEVKTSSKFGLFVGAGLSSFNVKTSNWVQPPINYNDSLNSVKSASNFNVIFGISYTLSLSDVLKLRPAIYLSLAESGKLNCERKTSTETLNFQSTSECLTIPVLYKFQSKKSKPYLSFGPSVLYHIGQSEETVSKMKFAKINILGQLGIGIEIPTKLILFAPELSFAKGFVDVKSNDKNIYTKTVSKLSRQYINFSLHLSRP